ncbi:MAG TPA: hypothetical protein VGV09_19250 [Steroidobacteraceae bacterium]|nr:hypothetical protein [Steroidobacteraceae bacterium]
MSAVLLGVFSDYRVADQARMKLFKDGFPTDRIDLTASCDPGQANLVPVNALHDKFVLYFGTLFRLAHERALAESLARRVDAGGATVTVHPRGTIETIRALEILKGSGAEEVAEHDLNHQALEHAASPRNKPWLSYLWPESTVHYHCIYCRLYGRREH